MLYIIFVVIFSVACGYIAKQKNKNTTIAYVLGAVLGLIALCYYLITPSEPGEEE